MKNLFKASVLAALISFGSTNVFAASEAPTVSDAHELIGDLIGNGRVCAHDSDCSKYVYSNYQGNNCTSSMNWNTNGDAEQVDWSRIISVVKGGVSHYDVTIFGALIATDKDGTKKEYKQAPFYFSDESSMKRAEKAMTLLMNSCGKKSRSKFD